MPRAQKAENIPQETAQTAAEQPIPMKVDVKIGSIRPEGSIRAYASVNLNDCFAIRNVKVMDSTALSRCMENDLPIIIFKLDEPDSIRRTVLGEQIGTLVSGEETPGIDANEGA